MVLFVATALVIDKRAYLGMDIEIRQDRHPFAEIAFGASLPCHHFRVFWLALGTSLSRAVPNEWEQADEEDSRCAHVMAQSLSHWRCFLNTRGALTLCIMARQKPPLGMYRLPGYRGQLGKIDV